MRSPLPAALLRALARSAGAAAAVVALSACSFITGVPSVARVELTVPVTVIAPGQSVQASGVPLRGNGSVITHSRRQVSFTSSDEKVVSVTPSGVITGVAPGRAVVTANVDGKRDQEEITVRPTPVRQVIISPRAPIVRLAPSITVLIGAAVLDTNNQALGNRPPNWRSLDTAVATITAAGAITPRAVGEARIVASVDTGLAPATGAVADTVRLRVTPVPIISVRVTPTTPTTYTGQTLQFSATVTDSLQRVVTDRRVVWSTADRGATLAVDSLTGLATAVAPSGGGTTITASVETVPGFPSLDFQRGSTAVAVLAPAVSARVVNAQGGVVTSIALRTGASQQVGFQALDAVGNVLNGRQFSVTSDTPAVATATVGGVVTAGTTPGAATITVQPLDASGAPQGRASTLTVTVTAQ
jgi:uncharacterized protein YjdB